MKNFLLIILVFSLCGCQAVKNVSRHIISSTSGINRQITLYSVDGHIIRGWHTTSMIEDEGSVVCFFDDDGNAIQISGTIIVEQIK